MYLVIIIFYSIITYALNCIIYFVDYEILQMLHYCTPKYEDNWLDHRLIISYVT
jgi:hypothetical protein